MQKKYILYLSTNFIWGGSEVLWTNSARDLNSKGYLVKACLNYGYELVNQYIPNEKNYTRNRVKRLPLIYRILQRAGLSKFSPEDYLSELLKKQKPDLVIISQGNNVDGEKFMKACVKYSVPFITITQLVTEHLWPGLNDKFIDELRMLYYKAKCNYFVSENTQKSHEKLLGEQFKNNCIAYNPFTKIIPSDISFPPVENNIYKIALIGRIETFHKGYDLLIEVLKNEKWKDRSIHFSLFGKGPHVGLLKRLIQQYNIANFTLHDHVENIAEIWKTHHILIMPSRMEGQSLTLIEAMHFNRAAIVTNVGGTSELIEEGVNGFIAEYPTKEAIDAALERAWERRKDWEQLGINAGKSIAQKYPADALLFFNQQIESFLAE